MSPFGLRFSRCSMVVARRKALVCSLTALTVIAVCKAQFVFGAEPTRTQLFSEIANLVETEFYDVNRAVAFRKVAERYRARAQAASTDRAFSRLINQMLAELSASHTRYLTPSVPAYYQLADIFSALPHVRDQFNDQEIEYVSVGILTEEIDDRYFVTSVLAGGPAVEAGVLAGDEIVAVSNRPYDEMQIFPGLAGQEIPVQLRRYTDAPLLELTVLPQMVRPNDEFLAAERNSVRIFERGNRRIGYIHIWSYAGSNSQKTFLQALAGDLKSADALIWDLRDGWGGADPSYLNVFNRSVPVISMQDRDGKEMLFNTQWRKPVVMLINERVRSGKEVLAYAFKKYSIGKVIGSQTAGAVLGGKLFFLSDKSLLYLAVKNAQVDGEKLEGAGVTPDINVPRDIRYAAGKDLQLQEAIDYFSRKL